MSYLSKKVLKTIQKKKVIPEPRWHFLLKNYVFWLFFIVGTFMGVLAVTVVLFMFWDYDWEVFEYLDRSLFEHIFISIPYFWIALLALFSVIAYYNFKHTRRGYRYKTCRVVIGSLLLSLSIGAILFWAGLDSEIHEIFLKQFPFYEKLVYTKKDIWIFPDKGLLSGEIINIKNRKDFKIRDFDGAIWQIQGNGTTWPEKFVFQKGARVKLIGERKDEHIFFVRVVKPWDWSR